MNTCGIVAGVILLIAVVIFLLVVLPGCIVSGWFREREEYLDWLWRQKK